MLTFPPRGSERIVAAAREAFGDDPFVRAFAEGQAMTLEQAVDCALQDEA